MIDHIVSPHPSCLCRELPRLEDLLIQVVEAHGDGHSWLAPTLEVFQTLKLDLSTHMVSEEERIFPSIRALKEEASGAFLDENGVDKMIREHDDSRVALDRLREPTNDYVPSQRAHAPNFVRP
ncbi:hemerythrin domain-containing protein [Salinibacter altiplanensis]|uniref:hemerythrin domain-containing protein n=1 Tax=Salinibacter altiplanensis TaxID=1803181 RepID=UPI001E427CDB|nr:hemerythrin domain-containing protein [Salinibacter altiplanensis]